MKCGHTLWVVDVIFKNFFGPRGSIQRIFSVLWNLNIKHESLRNEMCYHFPPMKKHTKEHEDFLKCIFTYIDDILIQIKQCSYRFE